MTGKIGPAWRFGSFRSVGWRLRRYQIRTVLLRIRVVIRGCPGKPPKPSRICTIRNRSQPIPQKFGTDCAVSIACNTAAEEKSGRVDEAGKRRITARAADPAPGAGDEERLRAAQHTTAATAVDQRKCQIRQQAEATRRTTEIGVGQQARSRHSALDSRCRRSYPEMDGLRQDWMMPSLANSAARAWVSSSGAPHRHIQVGEGRGSGHPNPATPQGPRPVAAPAAPPEVTRKVPARFHPQHRSAPEISQRGVQEVAGRRIRHIHQGVEAPRLPPAPTPVPTKRVVPDVHDDGAQRPSRPSALARCRRRPAADIRATTSRRSSRMRSTRP